MRREEGSGLAMTFFTKEVYRRLASLTGDARRGFFIQATNSRFPCKSQAILPDLVITLTEREGRILKLVV